MTVLLIEAIIIVVFLVGRAALRNKVRFFRGGYVVRRDSYKQDEKVRMLVEDTKFFRGSERNFRSLRVDGSNLVYSRIPLDPGNGALMVYSYCAPLLGILKGSGVPISRALVLGGGGGSVPRYILQNYEKAVVDTVEISPESIRISEKYFLAEFSGEGGRSHMMQDDAKKAVKALTGPYAFVFSDLYIGGQPVDAVLDTAYMQDMSRLAGEKGMLVINGSGLTIEGVRLVLKNLLGAFGHAWAIMVSEGFVLMASNAEMPGVENMVRHGQGIITLYPDTVGEFLKATAEEKVEL